MGARAQFGGTGGRELAKLAAGAVVGKLRAPWAPSSYMLDDRPVTVACPWLGMSCTAQWETTPLLSSIDLVIDTAAVVEAFEADFVTLDLTEKIQLLTAMLAGTPLLIASGAQQPVVASRLAIDLAVARTRLTWTLAKPQHSSLLATLNAGVFTPTVLTQLTAAEAAVRALTASAGEASKGSPLPLAKGPLANVQVPFGSAVASTMTVTVGTQDKLSLRRTSIGTVGGVPRAEPGAPNVPDDAEKRPWRLP